MYKVSKPFYHTQAWKKARAAALLRDMGMCVDCMERYRRGGAAPRRAQVVHHILPFEARPDLALELTNLKSLCEICHNKAHPEKSGRGDAGKATVSPLLEGVRVIKI